MPSRKTPRVCLLPGCGKRVRPSKSWGELWHSMACAAEYAKWGLLHHYLYWCNAESRWRFGRLARLWCRFRRHEIGE